MSQFKVSKSNALKGSVQVPGDKSISHRSIILGSLAEGLTTVEGFLCAEDTLGTLSAMRQLGVKIEREGQNVRVFGVGLHGLTKPDQVLDMGNSGTAIRLLSGVLAGQNFASTMTGDESLLKRPMYRVMKPLQEMGSTITSEHEGRPPLKIQQAKSGHINGITYTLPVASAQVKSCVLLAGLYAKGQTCVIEPAPTRDHTEKMLAGFGVKLDINGLNICMESQQKLTATHITVPGDISSAAFFLVAASLIPGSELLLTNVGMNPRRNAIVELLTMMGAQIEVINQHDVAGEAIADLKVCSAQLQGIEIPERLIPSAIDEFPVLFVAAACAEGETILRNATELRVKESDRIAVMAKGLQAMGVDLTEYEDGISIRGGTLKPAQLDSCGDHRCAMSFAIAASLLDQQSIIDDVDNVATSFPEFKGLINSIGAQIL
ncbi:MAG: 3-phosphoshikimate 1-carboxyvinyltransferase [bacterium]